MKRKIINIISIFIVITFILTTFSYGIFTPYIYEAEGNRVIAYAELNAATITLPSGKRIQSTNINGGTEMNVEIITEPMEVVLVIDVSGSMQIAGRIEKTIEAATKLIENLFNVATNIKVSIVTFSGKEIYVEEKGLRKTEVIGNAKIEIKRSSIKEDIIKVIKNLYAEGGTFLLPAIEKAQEIFSELEQEDSESRYKTKKFLINLTDGETEEEEECYNKLKELEKSNVKIYNILLESKYIKAFSRNGVDIGTIYYNISTGNLEEIYDEIYHMITFGTVDNSVGAFVENAQNYFVADNNLFMHLDNELLQGSRLDLEYIINIKTAFKCTKIVLQEEVDKKLNFNLDSKMISEDKTNADYGWKVNEKLSYQKYNDNDYHNLVLSITESCEDYDREYIIKRGEPYEAKLLLSCMLTNKEDTNYKNSLYFEVDGEIEDNIRWEATGNEEQTNKITGNLSSMEINIIPPFGEDRSYNKIWILILVSILAGSGVIYVHKNKKKRIIYQIHCTEILCRKFRTQTNSRKAKEKA